MNLYEKIKTKNSKIGVIGLGYVGLPLAVEKAKAGFSVLGFEAKGKTGIEEKGLSETASQHG